VIKLYMEHFMILEKVQIQHKYNFEDLKFLQRN
jgi:hypothetical protein